MDRRGLAGLALVAGLNGAAHGLSCAITAWRGEVRRTLLFDTGPEADVCERNVDRLGFDIGAVDAMMPSHGHWAVEALRGFALPRIVPAHCIGWRAVHALAGAFGDTVVPSGVGKTFRF